MNKKAREDALKRPAFQNWLYVDQLPENPTISQLENLEKYHIEIEPSERIQLHDYKGERYDVREIDFPFEWFDEQLFYDPFIAQGRYDILPEQERTYVQGRDWTINA